MLIDTHCHINMMVKKEFDTPLQSHDLIHAQHIASEAAYSDVSIIINVGTSLIESRNCVELAQHIPHVYAVIGIHPNDATASWKSEIIELKKLAQQKESLRIVGIGECGIDKHYPDFNLSQQRDVFKAQIELALEYDLALSIHSRDAADETLDILLEYKQDPIRGVMHCYSYDAAYAQEILAFPFVLGIGGTITYPKNDMLRLVVTSCPLDRIVLETDAPFLPIQRMRGKQNHPQYIKDIADFIADLKAISYDEVAQTTTATARKLFGGLLTL